jgi:hypothetical protein
MTGINILQLNELNKIKELCKKEINFDNIKEAYNNSEERKTTGELQEDVLKGLVVPLTKQSIDVYYNKLRKYLGKDYRFALIMLKNELTGLSKYNDPKQQHVKEILTCIINAYYDLLKVEFENETINTE